MSSNEDHIWCDVLDIDAAHNLLSRLCFYDLNVTSLGRFNTYQFRFKEKRYCWNLPSQSWMWGITRMEWSPTRTTGHHVTQWLNHTFRLSLLLIGLLSGIGIPSAFSFFPYIFRLLSQLNYLRTHLHKLCDHNTRQMTMSNYNYQFTAKSH